MGGNGGSVVLKRRRGQRKTGAPEIESRARNEKWRKCAMSCNNALLERSGEPSGTVAGGASPVAAASSLCGNCQKPVKACRALSSRQSKARERRARSRHSRMRNCAFQKYHLAGGMASMAACLCATCRALVNIFLSKARRLAYRRQRQQ